MALKPKTTKFGDRYSSFLSNASSEEIVSISKELSDELTAQSKSICTMGVSLIAISLISLMISAVYIAGSTMTVVGASKSLLLILELLCLSLIGLSIIFSGLAVLKSMNVSSVSALFWRHVRETADDEKVYEQRVAIDHVNMLVSTSKQNIKSAVILLVAGGLSLCIYGIYAILVSAGYL